MYYIDEFGIGLPIATSIVAYYFWRRRKELPNLQEDDSSLDTHLTA